MNRVEAHAATVRKLIESGLKQDGSPIGNVDTLDRELSLSLGERFAYQNAQAGGSRFGHPDATDEAMTVYRAVA